MWVVWTIDKQWRQSEVCVGSCLANSKLQDTALIDNVCVDAMSRWLRRGFFDGRLNRRRFHITLHRLANLAAAIRDGCPL